MNHVITIVGKSPTAIHAQDWIDACPGTDVATINEAGLILRDSQPIRFGFFCHARFALAMYPLWSRIETFVSPSALIGSQDLPAGFPGHKRMLYEGNACGNEPKALRARLMAGLITHHHTVTAAMSWLAKLGYKRLLLVGFHGGSGYSPGFAGAPEPQVDWVQWRKAEDNLAELLKEIYGVTTERWGE